MHSSARHCVEEEVRLVLERSLNSRIHSAVATMNPESSLNLHLFSSLKILENLKTILKIKHCKFFSDACLRVAELLIFCSHIISINSSHQPNCVIIWLGANCSNLFSNSFEFLPHPCPLTLILITIDHFHWEYDEGQTWACNSTGDTVSSLRRLNCSPLIWRAVCFWQQCLSTAPPSRQERYHIERSERPKRERKNLCTENWQSKMA